MSNNLTENIIEIGDIRINTGNEYNNFCLYPTKKFLNKKIGINRKYLESAPFKKMLYFGKPVLEILYFRIDVLDRYLEDPRYTIWYKDYLGSISFDINEDSYDRTNQDNTYLKCFGLAGNKKNRENLICAFIGDLSKLSPRHQFHFFSYMEKTNNNTIPNFNFYKNQIMGEPAEEESIFNAFLEEIKIINKMTKIICNTKLFKNEYSEADRKKLTYFHPFLKPTKKSFESFCQTLDKLFTDNLNVDCLIELDKIHGNKTPIQYNNDGKIKDGHLTILKKFIESNFTPLDNSNPSKLILEIWTKRDIGIRAIRSKSSHYIRENQYDLQIFGMFHKTMKEAYTSIRYLRLMLTNCPSVKKSKNSRLAI